MHGFKWALTTALVITALVLTGCQTTGPVGSDMSAQAQPQAPADGPHGAARTVTMIPVSPALGTNDAPKAGEIVAPSPATNAHLEVKTKPIQHRVVFVNVRHQWVVRSATPPDLGKQGAGDAAGQVKNSVASTTDQYNTSGAVGKQPQGAQGGYLVPMTRTEEGVAIMLGKVAGEGGDKCRYITTLHTLVEPQATSTSISLGSWTAVETALTVFPAEMIWSDPKLDLAVLDSPGHEHCADLRDVNLNASVAETIYAFGQPTTLRGHISRGIISSYVTTPEYGYTIISDAPIVHGFSGGAAFDGDWKLAGMVMADTSQAYKFAMILPMKAIITALTTADKMPPGIKFR